MTELKTLKDILDKTEGERYEASDSYSDCASALGNYTEDLQAEAKKWIKQWEQDLALAKKVVQEGDGTEKDNDNSNFIFELNFNGKIQAFKKFFNLE